MSCKGSSNHDMRARRMFSETVQAAAPPLPKPAPAAPPTGPRVHPDRLAAIRGLRDPNSGRWDPPKGPRSESTSTAHTNGSWDASSSSTRAASSSSSLPSANGLPPRPLVPNPPPAHPGYELGRELMSKMGSHPSLFGSQNGRAGDPKYSPRQSSANVNAAYARRDSYPNASTVGSGQWNNQRR